MSVSLHEYQKEALNTVTEDGRGKDLEYLIPGIVGEVGELFGQVAKSYWHHGAKLDAAAMAGLQELLVKEYGDIAWGTAVLLDTEGIQAVQQRYLSSYATRPRIWQAEADPWQELLQAATDVHLAWKAGTEYYYLDEVAQVLWVVLERNCLAITGHTFEHVLETNVAKLADRAARGVLKGAGDLR